MYNHFMESAHFVLLPLPCPFGHIQNGNSCLFSLFLRAAESAVGGSSIKWADLLTFEGRSSAPVNIYT